MGLRYLKLRKATLCVFFIITICYVTIPAIADTKGSIEQLFLEAMQVSGQEYVDLRGQILAVAEPNDAYLGKLVESDDLKTRIIAKAILERIQDPQKYRHFEELMIVPIVISITQGEMRPGGARPYETLKSITHRACMINEPMNKKLNMDPRTINPDYMSHYHSQSFCHNDTAYYFLAEIAIKNSMNSVPKLANKIPSKEQSITFTLEEAAEIVGVLPLTIDVWQKAGLFSDRGNNNSGTSDNIRINNIEQFYRIVYEEPRLSRYFPSEFTLEQIAQLSNELIQNYAVMMLCKFNKPQNPELLYEIYQSGTAREFCVNGFSAKTQLDELRQAMKATKAAPIFFDPRAMRTSETKVVPDELVRQAAIIKSMENPEEFTSEEYLEMISDTNHITNQYIAEALGKKRDPNDLDALKNMLKHKENNSDNYQAIIKTIFSIDTNYIYTLLENKDDEIRNIAWRNLKYSNITFPLRLDYLSKNLNDSKLISATMELIEKYHPEALPGFLDHPNPEVRQQAVGQLRRREKTTTIRDTLLAHLQDKDAEVRWSILEALFWYKSDKIVRDAFMNALKDTDPSCRKSALISLDSYGIGYANDKKLLSCLIEALKIEQNSFLRDRILLVLENTTAKRLTKEQWMQWWQENKDK